MLRATGHARMVILQDELHSALLAWQKCVFGLITRLSGRWQAPAAVLPEGPKDKVYGHSRARRARKCPKHASPRARRARGRAELNARLGACQCYYMFL